MCMSDGTGQKQPAAGKREASDLKISDIFLAAGVAKDYGGGSGDDENW